MLKNERLILAFKYVGLLFVCCTRSFWRVGYQSHGFPSCPRYIDVVLSGRLLSSHIMLTGCNWAQLIAVHMMSFRWLWRWCLRAIIRSRTCAVSVSVSMEMTCRSLSVKHCPVNAACCLSYFTIELLMFWPGLRLTILLEYHGIMLDSELVFYYCKVSLQSKDLWHSNHVH